MPHTLLCRSFILSVQVHLSHFLFKAARAALCGKCLSVRRVISSVYQSIRAAASALQVVYSRLTQVAAFIDAAIEHRCGLQQQPLCECASSLTALFARAWYIPCRVLRTHRQLVSHSACSLSFTVLCLSPRVRKNQDAPLRIEPPQQRTHICMLNCRRLGAGDPHSF